MSLIEFIQSTHKSVENRPEPYGVFHLIFVALSLVVMITICYLMRKSSEKTFRAVLLSIGILLCLSEVYKQLYYIYAAGGEGYDWWVFPFQLCSVPMYLCVIAGCLKKCRLRDMICEYLISIGFLGGIMAYAEPSGILNPYYFTLIHSCLWHAILIFIALYILFTDNACHSLKSYKGTLIMLAGVVGTATLLNIIFRDKPDFNMCYMSPFYNTPLAVFKDFDEFFKGILGDIPGRSVSVMIYVVAVSLGGFIIHSLSYLIKEKLIKNRKGI